MFQQQELKKLSTIYSTGVLKELGSKGYSNRIISMLTEIDLLDKFARKKLVYFFEEIYSALVEHYRSEHIYKSAIINKILFGRHSVNTSAMFTEFAVDNSIADVVFFNGTSTVYEIKTEYDDFKRLENQINSYRKAFEKIYVVSHSSHIDNLINQVESDIGLIVLTSNYSLQTVREATSNLQNIDNSVIFRSLRKSEYLTIIKEHYGFIPDVPNTEIYKESLKIINQIDPKILHDDYVRLLRKRNKSLKYINFISSLPHSLKSLASATDYNNREKDSILSSLKNPIINNN